MRKISGTAEWAVTNVNYCTGCRHNCRYCFARYNACDRFGFITRGEWENQRIREHDVKKARKLEKGTVMFSSTHDIVPETLDACCIVLEKLLIAGNHVLIVSKPHLPCIERLCLQFSRWQDKILFRFTIGSVNDKVLKFWEPGAPCFDERKACLKLAFEKGFKTSVSCEPLLDPANVVMLYEELNPFITDSIWFGKLNKPEKRVDMAIPGMREELDKVLQWQTDDAVRSVYEALKGRPHVRWKESYKEVLGLKLADEAGLDV